MRVLDECAWSWHLLCVCCLSLSLSLFISLSLSISLPFSSSLSVSPSINLSLSLSVSVVSYLLVSYRPSVARAQVLSNLSKNSASGTDYFKILVAVFVDVLAGSDQQHLKNFYAMCVFLALCLVYIYFQHFALLSRSFTRFLLARSLVRSLHAQRPAADAQLC